MQISEQDKREGIAGELADILLRQQNIVNCNRTFSFSNDEKFIDLFQDMAEDDEKNLRLLETVLSNLGLRVDPRDAAIRLSEAIIKVVQSHSSLESERLAAYALLKQDQMMHAHLLYKSLQLAQPDIKAAAQHFDAVYASISGHVAQLLAYQEETTVSAIMGEKPRTGALGRARDLANTVIGTFLSKTAVPADEMSILSVLTMDHRKVSTLFKEIEAASEHQQALDLFNQLKTDLTAHSEAEEETVYMSFESVPKMKRKIDGAWQEHRDIRILLDDITDNKNDPKFFSNHIKKLQNLVEHHVEEEEDEIFDLIKKNSTEEERIKLSEDFLQAKKGVQEVLVIQGIEEPVADLDRESGVSSPL